MLFPTLSTQYGLLILAALGSVDARVVARSAEAAHGLVALSPRQSTDLITRKIEPLMLRSSEEKRSPEAHYRGGWGGNSDGHGQNDWYKHRQGRPSTTAPAAAPTPTVVADVTVPSVVQTTAAAQETAQATTSPSTSSGSLDADQAAALKLHNDGRIAKGLTPLVWDDALTANAQSWASHLAQINQMVHSTGDDRPNQGENLAWAKSSNGISNPLTGGAQMWMGEASNYKGQAIPQGDFGSYGHYTQCMWKTTTKVGIAFAKAPDGGVYTVARYSPPGNMGGQTPF